MNDGTGAFGLNILGLELAIQCALWVESQHPGCCCFALDCGIDSVHSYQSANGGYEKSTRRIFYHSRVREGVCTKCSSPAVPGFKKCSRHLSAHKKAAKRYRERIKNGLQSQI